MRKRGFKPSAKAGKATETAIDFRDRGGRFTISRRSSPLSSRSIWCAIASTAQPDSNVWPGLRVENTLRKKEGKWERRTASKTCPSSSGLMIRELMACLPSCREPPSWRRRIHRGFRDRRRGPPRIDLWSVARGIAIDEDEEEP